VNRDLVVGWLGFGPARDEDCDPALVAELYGIYLLPEYWSMGYGKQLYGATETRIRQSLPVLGRRSGRGEGGGGKPMHCRFVRKSPRGAHLLLQIRTRVLDEEWANTPSGAGTRLSALKASKSRKQPDPRNLPLSPQCASWDDRQAP